VTSRAVALPVALLTALGIALGTSACLAGATALPGSASGRTGTSVGSASAPAGGAPAAGRPGSAVATLRTLAVKGRAPKTGYARSQFGQAWTDAVNVDGGHNGCDTRNDILRRDLSSATTKPSTHGCVVLSGSLRDPHSGRTLAFRRGGSTSSLVQIDHVVALSDAWQTGAGAWPAARRTTFANDPLNLLAVQGSLNSAKGDGDAATWLMPNTAFRCPYVARQVAVKARYGLWLTPAERDAMSRVLAGCPAQPLPTAAQTDVPPPR